MFPSAKTRIAAAAVRGLDRAIEFATLGEYRLPVPAQGTQSGERRRDGRFPYSGYASAQLSGSGALASGIRTRPNRLRPATAAARRLQPPVPMQRIPSHSGVRALALSSTGAQPARGARMRAGAARPRPQPCLVADAGVAAGMSD
jgi:hypothetical protein